MAALVNRSLRPIVLLLLALLPVQTFAVNVIHQAAIGIGVSIGVLVILTVSGLIFIKYYKRKERRLALERGEVELTEEGISKPTRQEAIDAQPQNVNIWQGGDR
ncbi:hypothetical protein LTR08_008228 [Meristemomyces frigidus]|nr:hypothetical protein LTR08_008228 [Meristemomyces frigidus]